MYNCFEPSLKLNTVKCSKHIKSCDHLQKAIRNTKIKQLLAETVIITLTNTGPSAVIINS